MCVIKGCYSIYAARSVYGTYRERGWSAFVGRQSLLVIAQDYLSFGANLYVALTTGRCLFRVAPDTQSRPRVKMGA